MFKKITLMLCAFLFISMSAFAQETWSLERCILYAWENNISVKRAEINVQSNQLNEKGSKMSRLPNLNGSIGGAYQFGRTIDPVTNDFNSLSIGTNSLRLDAGVTLFNGNRINNSIKQASFNIQAAMNDLAQTKNDISLTIASAYINVLFAEEQLEAARKRKELTEAQLAQIDKLINAGARPRNERLDILAALARNDQAIITQENLVENGLLNLKNLLFLDSDKDIRLEKPGTIEVPSEDNPDLLNVKDIYQIAISRQPFVKADESRVKSAELGKDIGFEEGRETRLFAFPDNPSVIVPVEEIVPDLLFSDNPYFDQLNENFGQSIGLNVSIPIYNNHRTIINMDQAELNVLNNEYTAEINKQNLKNNIQTALANARAAKRTLQASQTTVDATRAAFENSQKQFDLGVINSFEYATTRNNWDQAEVDLIIAKYDYIFKLKILDFYQGKKLEL